MSATASSTRWFRTRPTAPCSNPAANSSTPASRRSWRSASRKPPKPNPSYSRITTRALALRNKRLFTGTRLANAPFKARQRGGDRALLEGAGAARTVPEAPERLRARAALQTRLGPAVITVKGQAAPDVEAVYNRARELCDQVGDCPDCCSRRCFLRPPACFERGIRRGANKAQRNRRGPRRTEPRVPGTLKALGNADFTRRVRRRCNTA